MGRTRARHNPEGFNIGDRVRVQLPYGEADGVIEKLSRDYVFARIGRDLLKFPPENVTVMNPRPAIGSLWYKAEPPAHLARVAGIFGDMAELEVVTARGQVLGHTRVPTGALGTLYVPERNQMIVTRRNPRGGEADEVAARELVLFIDNDADLYRQQHVPILMNLWKKMKAGKYDHEKAVKLWGYLAESGAKKYAKEIGGDASSWSSIFTPAPRRLAAAGLADDGRKSLEARAFDFQVDPVKFRELAVGEAFEFKNPSSQGMQGPWIKTGKSTYTPADAGNILAGQQIRVGTMNVQVERVKRNPSHGRSEWHTGKTYAVRRAHTGTWQAEYMPRQITGLGRTPEDAAADLLVSMVGAGMLAGGTHLDRHLAITRILEDAGVSRTARNPRGQEPAQSLYDEAVACGIPVDCHESDLYLLDTPIARELCRKHGYKFGTFLSEVDNRMWLDVPFACDPFWKSRERRNPRALGGVAVVRVKFSASEVWAIKKRWPASGLPSGAMIVALLKDTLDVIEIHPKPTAQAQASGALAAIIQEARDFLRPGGGVPNPSFRISGTVKAYPVKPAARGAAAPRRRKPRARLAIVPASPAAPAKLERVLEPHTPVSVPYTGRGSYFGRKVKKTRERATVQGMVELPDGSPGVLVLVRRGKGAEQHTFPLSAVRRLPRQIRKTEKERYGNRVAKLVKRYKNAPESLAERIERVTRERESLYDELRGMDMNAQDPAWRSKRAKFTRVGDELKALEWAANEIAGPEPWAVAANPRRSKNDWCAVDASGSYFWEGSFRMSATEARREASKTFKAWTGRRLTAPIRVMRIHERQSEIDAMLKSKSNPSPRQLERATDTFRMWHEFDPTRLTPVKVPSRKMPEHLVELGRVRRIDYDSNKWEGKTVTYTHSTKRPYPVLATDPEARQLYLVGGKMRPTADGLVN